MLKNSKITSLPRYSFETCIRFLIKDLLPNTIDRFVYLDPDIVNNNSLEDFYNIDLENNILNHIQK